MCIRDSHNRAAVSFLATVAASESVMRVCFSVSFARPKSSTFTYPSGLTMMFFFAELGEKDKAFTALNEALETKDQHTAWMKVDPYMDPLRNAPRFKEVPVSYTHLTLPTSD